MADETRKIGKNRGGGLFRSVTSEKFAAVKPVTHFFDEIFSHLGDFVETRQ